MSAKTNTSTRRDGGYALITALLFFIAGGTAALATISDGVLREGKTIGRESLSKQGYFASESALEDAVYRIKSSKQMGSSGTLAVGVGTSTVSVSTLSDGTQQIVSSSRATDVIRKTSATVSGGNTVGFSYVLQSGVGGIDIGAGIQVIGDMYTTGSINGGSNSSISGMAVAAETATIGIDQNNSTPSIPTQSITFGAVSGSQDFAQSFQVSSNASLMSLRLYVKKVGNPSNATIKVTGNASGNKPNFWNPIASGTLSSSLVSTSYGWIDITLTANPDLTAGTTYWIVIDANANASSYYVIGANSTYSDGQAKIGRGDTNSWGNTSPSGLDGYFAVMTGSNDVGITGQDEWNRLSVGTAYANQVSFVNASNIIYCQSGGSNNKPCDTTRANPIIEQAPFSQETIDLWKAEALAGGTVSTQSVGWAGSTLGPKKINGNLNVAGGGLLNISGTLWVTGTVTMSGGSRVKSASPTQSYTLVADGGINVSGGAEIQGSGTSYILLLSTGTADPTISLSGGANNTAIAAPFGGVSVNGGSSIRAIYAKRISISGGASVEYDPGMSSLNLSGGSSSGGALNIKSWKETQ
jgi:hypothetical protein